MAATGGGKVLASSSMKAPGKTPAASSSTKKDAKGNASPPSRRLRVMCLHGFRTSASIMEKQVELAQWAPFVDDLVEFVYMNAPYPSTGRSDVEKKFDPPYFEWYQANQSFLEVVYVTQDYTEIYGLEESIVQITAFIKSRGPFDGLMGFSQGAILVGALTGLQEKGLALPGVQLFSFIVLIGGAKSKALVLKPAYFDPITTASLHFIGEKDFMKEGGELLAQTFKDPTIIRHPHGHLIPKLGEEETNSCRAFFKKFFDLKYPETRDNSLNSKAKAAAP